MIFTVFILFFIIQKFASRKTYEQSPVTIIDYDKPNDIMPTRLRNGESLFRAKCKMCHNILGTDNYILGFEKRWQDRNELIEFIRSPSKVIKRNEYARQLEKKLGVRMTEFPELSDSEIQEILDFIIWESKVE